MISMCINVCYGTVLQDNMQQIHAVLYHGFALYKSVLWFITYLRTSYSILAFIYT